MFQYNWPGTINVVTDISLAMQFSQTCKIVYIGELNPSVPQNFIEFSILLPPFQALDAELNGNQAEYNRIYWEYLTYNASCFEAIMSIIAASYMGKNIILYIENGDELSHKQFLFDYFLQRFGIQLGTDKTNFIAEYRPYMMVLLYSFMDGFLTFDEITDVIIGTNCNTDSLFGSTMAAYGFIDPYGKVIRDKNLIGIRTPIDVANWVDAYIKRKVTYTSGLQNGFITWNKEAK